MRHMIAILLAACGCATPLTAQLAAGMIVNRSFPVTASYIDAGGNVYTTSTVAPVTTGAAQTQSGGGTCYRSLGGFVAPPTPGPCLDVHLAKVDAAGNTVFGTLLGGSK